MTDIEWILFYFFCSLRGINLIGRKNAKQHIILLNLDSRNKGDNWSLQKQMQ